jgi:hypothetical protein
VIEGFVSLLLHLLLTTVASTGGTHSARRPASLLGLIVNTRRVRRRCSNLNARSTGFQRHLGTCSCLISMVFYWDGLRDAEREYDQGCHEAGVFRTCGGMKWRGRTGRFTWQRRTRSPNARTPTAPLLRPCYIKEVLPHPDKHPASVILQHGP